MRRFKHILYDALNARQKELYTFQKVAAALADYGFNCIRLTDDWQGADFLAYHVNRTTTRRNQMKSRITIQRKYVGKGIWFVFPHKGIWYLIKHDDQVARVGEHTGWLHSESWRVKNSFHSASINPELLDSLAGNKLGPVYGDRSWKPANKCRLLNERLAPHGLRPTDNFG